MATALILLAVLGCINIIGCIYDFFNRFYFMALLHLFAFIACVVTIMNNSRWI